MDACYCDYDPPFFYHSTDVARAREPHKCYECFNAILPGESYEQVRVLWDKSDGPQTVHTCAWCMELREWITANVPCFCFAHGYLLEGAAETVDEYAHQTTGLRFGFLRRKALINRRPSLEQLTREAA